MTRIKCGTLSFAAIIVVLACLNFFVSIVWQSRVPHDFKLSNKTPHEGCRTLWFAGFFDGDNYLNAYAQLYSIALLSSLQAAPGLLQPVLLVGHLEEDKKQISLEVQREKDRFYRLVQEQGAIVIHRDENSFQEILNQYYGYHPPSLRQGPFLRMDIPTIILEHRLFDIEGVCTDDDTVIYTDSDVLFLNLTQTSLEEAKDIVNGSGNSSAFVAYGPEHKKNEVSVNTGVMLFSPGNFGRHLADILEFGSTHNFEFQSLDQGLLNAYFDTKPTLRAFLPFEWNYKCYWGYPDATESPPRIIHFHGPKPRRGNQLECLASMNRTSPTCELAKEHPVWSAYEPLINIGFSRDGGQLANKTLELCNEFISNSTW